MAKIGSYPIQSTIIGTDKVIGTDVLSSGATKNFTFNDVAKFLNTYNKIELNALFGGFKIKNNLGLTRYPL